jgi:thiol-disulfide isomerase/thioredoxin
MKPSWIVSIVLSAPLAFAQDMAPLFQKLDFDAALAKSRADKRIFVLDAMTSWCGPCKQMDATTWRAASVVQWFDDNGLAVQLDMDRNVELKETLKIKAFPTLIAFKDGVEFDRVVGSRDESEFLSWLGDVKSGTTAKQRLLQQLEKARAGGASAWDERAQIAGELLWYDEFDTATRELEWLWSNAAGGEDVMAIVGTTRQLVNQHPQAATTLAAVRAPLSERVRAGSASPSDKRRWIDFNFALDDDAATADWADGLAKTDAGLSELRTLENRLFALLVAQGRWRTAGLVLVDPVADTRRQGSQIGAYDIVDEPSGAMSMPAIPLMKPSTSGAQDAGAEKSVPGSKPAIPTSAPSTASKPKIMPAIPAVPVSRDKAGAVTKRPETAQEIAHEVRERLTWQLRSDASDRYAALLAAGRTADAAAVASALIEASDEPRSRAALVSRAMRAGQLETAHMQHQRWLDEASD